MASEIKVSVTKVGVQPTVSGINTQLMDLSQLGHVPQLAREIIRTVGPQQGILRFLSQLPDMTSETELFGEMFVKWGTEVEQKLYTVILQPGYSGNTALGSTGFTLPVKNNIFQVGANILLQDHRTELVVVGVQPIAGTGALLTCQPTSANLDVTLLRPGNPVNFSGSSYQQGSTHGHMPQVQQNVRYFLQALQTVRSDLAITGDARTQNYAIEMTRPDDMNYAYSGFLPDLLRMDGTSFMEFHLTQLNNQLWHGTPNYDLTTGQIYNTINGAPVAKMMGMKYQLENAPGGYREDFDPSANSEAILQMLTRAQAHVSKKWNQYGFTLYACGGAGARLLIRNAAADWMKNNTNINVMVDGKGNGAIAEGFNTLPSFPNIEVFNTPFGKINFMHMDQADDRTMDEFDSVALPNGPAYPRSSYAIYLFPVFRMGTGADGLPRTNIGIIGKGKDGINRTLTAGVIEGMTGARGGARKIFGKSMDGVAMPLGNYRPVSTGADQDTFMLLSQMAVIMRVPELTAWMNPYGA